MNGDKQCIYVWSEIVLVRAGIEEMHITRLYWIDGWTVGKCLSEEHVQLIFSLESGPILSINKDILMFSFNV